MQRSGVVKRSVRSDRISFHDALFFSLQGLEKLVGVSGTKTFAAFDAATFKKFSAALADVASKLQSRNDPSSLKWHGKVELERTIGRYWKMHQATLSFRF